ncbi:hypothetical protein ACIP6P_14225 [Streptomyces sp. NPDC088729]|uniref:hypothetical protein n=1 Tax=Streptomyces sp. NPDC088729 TaxID=3365876 RepID=UPI003806991B
MRAMRAVEVQLRLRFPRPVRARTPRPPDAHDPAFAELRRIESDHVHRALFLAELDAAITDRDAEREAVLNAIEAAAALLRSMVLPGGGGGSA